MKKKKKRKKKTIRKKKKLIDLSNFGVCRQGGMKIGVRRRSEV